MNKKLKIIQEIMLRNCKIMRTNDVLELRTEQMSYGPAAIARFNLQNSSVVIFVHGAAPSETVRAQLTKKHKNFWEAQTLEILEPSQVRVKPQCPVFGKCGGCQWQHISYEGQLLAKKNILLHQLSRATQQNIQELETKLQIHPAHSTYGYRNRIQVRGDQNGIGFFASGSHEIIYSENCLIAHSDIQNAWKSFLQTDLSEFSRPYKIEWTRLDTGQVHTSLNQKHAALGFNQINSEQNLKLVSLIHQLALKAPNKNYLMDLYGGQGNLSQGLRDYFSTIHCVDSSNSGSDPSDIHENQNFLLIQSPVEDFIRDQYWKEWQNRNPDCIIADPPREGLRGVANLILQLQAPRLVLASCDPSTLARDLTSLLTLYQIEEIHLVDMFPQTFHMEVVIGCNSKKHEY